MKKLTTRWTPLREHKTQVALYQSERRFNVVPAGRRCLAKDTFVCTPEGPVKIQNIKVGDTVIGYNQNGIPEETTVTETHNNKRQYVSELVSSNKVFLKGTKNHKLLACNEMYYDLNRIHMQDEYGYKKRQIKDINKRYRVRTAYCFDLIKGGNKSIPHTYILAALLGDGCSRENKNGIKGTGVRQKNLYISSDDHIIPEYIVKELGCIYIKNHKNNYTYKIQYGHGAIDAVPFYKEWCSGRYAHEKVAQWKEVNQWDKASCLSFLAGIIDTDGSIHYKTQSKKQVILQIGMQAKKVIRVCSKIIFKYFQVKTSINIDARSKYKNGPVYSIQITSNLHIKRILPQLNKYLIKKKNFDCSKLKYRNILPDRIGLKKGKVTKELTYDITVNNTTNLYILHHGGIVTSNSGKTEIIGKRKQVLRFLLCHDKRFPQFYSQYPDPKYFIGAPTRDQVKRIYWDDVKALIPKEFLSRPPNESNLVLYGINGAELHLLGLDKPERAEGSPWDHGVIDEIGNIKAQAWEAHIRPALSDRRGGCDFIGVPEGKNHYYDMYNRALDYEREFGDKSEWGVFHWISADILPKEEIMAAKRDLDPLVYEQEYEASFVNFTGMAYYNFSSKIHIGNYRQYYDPTRPIVFCFDFNIAPGVCAVLQELGTDVFKVDIGTTVTIGIGEVHIPSMSNTIVVCNKLIEDWGEHPGDVICYGDSTGGAEGSAKIRGSDWDLIKEALTPVFGDRLYFNVPKDNPKERQRVNAFNSRLMSASGDCRFLLDEKYCKHLIKDLEGVRVIEGSAGQLDKKDLKLTHISDAVGYYIHYEFPVFKYFSADDIKERMKEYKLREQKIAQAQLPSKSERIQQARLDSTALQESEMLEEMLKRKAS